MEGNEEADRLAKLIEGIVASGINVYDSDENIYRPAEYRDIVILTRSVTAAIYRIYYSAKKQRATLERVFWH